MKSYQIDLINLFFIYNWDFTVIQKKHEEKFFYYFLWIWSIYKNKYISIITVIFKTKKQNWYKNQIKTFSVCERKINKNYLGKFFFKKIWYFDQIDSINLFVLETYFNKSFCLHISIWWIS